MRSCCPPSSTTTSVGGSGSWPTRCGPDGARVAALANASVPRRLRHDAANSSECTIGGHPADVDRVGRCTGGGNGCKRVERVLDLRRELGRREQIAWVPLARRLSPRLHARRQFARDRDQDHLDEGGANVSGKTLEVVDDIGAHRELR